MSTATNTHIFVATDGSKSPCSVCGKTRNTKAHKQAQAELAAQVESDVAMETAMDEEAAQLDEAEGVSQEEFDAEVARLKEEADVAAAREDMLPGADESTDDSEIADDLARLEEQEAAKAAAAKPAKKASAKKAAKPGEPTATIWVGWRITNAAVLRTELKVAAKLKAAKPTADLDRTVKLTAEELAELDTIAATFQEPGRSGPEQYSGRALRGRIAAALAKIEEASK